MNIRLISLLVLAASLISGLLWHIHKDNQLKDELVATQVKLAETNTRLQNLQVEYTKATVLIDDLTTKASQSASERKRIESDYKSRIAALQKQRIPTTCQDAIQWAIDSKSDISWK